MIASPKLANEGRGAYNAIIFYDGDLIVAEDNVGKTLKENTNAATVIQAIVNSYSDIVITDNMNIGTQIDIPNDHTKIRLLEDVTLTATATIASIFRIDPVTHTRHMNYITIDGGTLNCDNKASSAIRVTGGNFPNNIMYYMDIYNVTAKNAIVASFRLDTADHFNIFRCVSNNSDIGILIDDGCFNSNIAFCYLYNDDSYGIKILKQTQRIEGLNVTDTNILYPEFGLYFEEGFDCRFNNLELDQHTKNALTLKNVHEMTLSNSWISQNLSTDTNYGANIFIKGSCSDINIESCSVNLAYKYGLIMYPDGSNCANNITISNCYFGANDRQGGNADIINDSGRKIIISNTHLGATGSNNYAEYSTYRSPNYLRLIANDIANSIGPIVSTDKRYVANINLSDV
jgi:hypothetical protein